MVALVAVFVAAVVLAAAADAEDVFVPFSSMLAKCLRIHVVLAEPVQRGDARGARQGKRGQLAESCQNGKLTASPDLRGLIGSPGACDQLQTL